MLALTKSLTGTGIKSLVPYSIRRFSNEAIKSVESSPGQPSELDMTNRYQEIVSSMKANKANYEKKLLGDKRVSLPHNSVFQNKELAAGFTDIPPKVGDLVEVIDRGPAVVIRLPTDEQPDACILYMSSGRLKTVSRSRVAFTLGEYVHGSALQDVIRVVDQDGEESSQLIRPVRRALYLPLRRFIEKSLLSLEAAAVELSGVFSNLQKPDQAVNIPFFDLVREVDYRLRLKSGELPNNDGLLSLSGQFPPARTYSPEYGMKSVSPSITHIVYSAIRHNFSRTVLTDLGPWGSGSFTVTVLSKKEVAKKEAAVKVSEAYLDSSVEEQSLKTELTSLIKKYALGDITSDDPDALSAAIMATKNLSNYNGEPVEPFLAMSLLDEKGLIDQKIAPSIDRERYAFLKQDKTSHEPALFSGQGNEYPDSMEKIRQEAAPEVPVYSIDAASAHEIDDGISLKKLDDSKYAISIHIADPASLFDKLDDTDGILSRAYLQSSTAYFPSCSLPMLPKSLTDSLGLNVNPDSGNGQRSFCVSFHYDTLSDAVVNGSEQISLQFVKKMVPITYQEVDEILTNEQKLNSPHYSNLSTLHSIAEALWKKRMEYGLELRLPRKSVTVDVESGEISLSDTKIGASHSERLVSEMMIKANNIVAKFTDSHRIPNIYRTQAVKLENPRDRDAYNQLLLKYPALMGAPLEDSLAAIKYMRPAQLSVEPGVHTGLGLSHYCHGTSPLRRFQDILTHWQVESYLRDGPRNERVLNENQILAIMRRIESNQRLSKSAQLESIMFWTLKKIQQVTDADKIAGRTPALYKALTTSTMSERSQTQSVYLPDWGISARLAIVDGDEPHPLGSWIECMVDDVRPMVLSLTMRR